PWEGAKPWEIAGCPGPDFVTRLSEHSHVEAAFLDLIPPNREGRLKRLLELVRDGLSFEAMRRPGGLPSMLLARLPHQLIDVLLLMSARAQQGPTTNDLDLLAPFALY